MQADGYRVNEVGYHPGHFRAGADSVTITVFGRGGHGAFPLGGCSALSRMKPLVSSC